MSTLFGNLYIGQQALQAQQYGLQITQKNIANTSTPGYSRERVELVPDSIRGVSAEAVQTFRNRFLDYRITQELQIQGEQQSITTMLQQVEAYLNEGGGQGLQTALDEFFNSFSDLANAPEDPSLRQQVLAQAGNLSSQITRVYQNIQSAQTAADVEVSDTVQEINSLTAKIADLNITLMKLHGTQSQEEATARDQMQQLVDKLAGMIDLSYFETERGALTVTTKQGDLLVAGDQNRVLQAVTSPADPYTQVLLDGQNITSQIESGKLGGLLEVRDRLIPDYLRRLDDLAAGLIERVNSQHAQGSDLNGLPGGDFFIPFVPSVPGSNAGAARTIALAITDATQIAAAGSGLGTGSNANAVMLAGIRDEKLFSSGSATSNQFYANLIFGLGKDLRAAQDGQTTQDQLLAQLQNQRDAFSGVNLDEEAVNIIRYQKAYEANARFIRVVDELTDDLLGILGY